MVYLTGDTHGDFSEIIYFSKIHQTNIRDVMVVLGDAGLNYHLNRRDDKKKRKLRKLHLTILCIHGNHEQRPQEISGYIRRRWRGGIIYVDMKYPNILFAVDGEIYNLEGVQAMAIGGAYSVDKYLRLAEERVWFPNEQLTESSKRKIEKELERQDWKIDVILSHTAPLRYEPEEVTVLEELRDTQDKTMEVWLDYIEEKLEYGKWYCGHYHIEKIMNKVQILYENFEKLEG